MDEDRWITQTLQRLGIRLTCQIELQRKTAWSVVKRVASSTKLSGVMAVRTVCSVENLHLLA